MEEQRLHLLLLLGMDGTGELFADFVKLLPGWIEPHILSYPRDRKLSYDQLSAIVRLAFPPDKPFAILAESFSTPLAVALAAENSKGLRALVLCAGFISPPRRDVLSRLALILAPAIFKTGLPTSVCRRFLVGKTASKSLVDSVCSTVSGISGAVLADRLRSVLSCNAENELRTVSVPLLYLAGLEDRLISPWSFQEIQRIKPDAQFEGIEAPHLILQAKPCEAVDAVVRFLQQIYTKDGGETVTD